MSGAGAARRVPKPSCVRRNDRQPSQSRISSTADLLRPDNEYRWSWPKCAEPLATGTCTLDGARTQETQNLHLLFFEYFSSTLKQCMLSFLLSGTSEREHLWLTVAYSCALGHLSGARIMRAISWSSRAIPRVRISPCRMAPRWLRCPTSAWIGRRMTVSRFRLKRSTPRTKE